MTLLVTQVQKTINIQADNLLLNVFLSDSALNSFRLLEKTFILPRDQRIFR